MGSSRDGDVLRAPVAVMDQSALLGLPCIKRLLQGIKNKVRLHVAADSPAHDKPREHIDNKGHICKALPGRDKGEVSHPELVGALCGEVTVDPIQRVRGYRIRPGGPYPSSSRRLTCQGYKLKVEVPGLQTLDLKIAGGNLPRDSWGRYSL